MRARARRGRFDAPPRRGEPAVPSATAAAAAAANPFQGREGTPGSVGANQPPWYLTPAGTGSLSKGVLAAPNLSSASPARSARRHRRCRLAARRLESAGGETQPETGELCGFLPSPRPGSLRAPTKPRTQTLNTHTYTHQKKCLGPADTTHRQARGTSTRSELPREQFQIGTEK